MQPCPVPGCTRKRQEAHVTCGICWSRVSPTVQRQVYRAWAKFQNHTLDWPDYLAIRQVAIDEAAQSLRVREADRQ